MTAQEPPATRERDGVENQGGAFSLEPKVIAFAGNPCLVRTANGVYGRPLGSIVRVTFEDGLTVDFASAWLRQKAEETR